MQVDKQEEERKEKERKKVNQNDMNLTRIHKLTRRGGKVNGLLKIE